MGANFIMPIQYPLVDVRNLLGKDLNKSNFITPITKIQGSLTTAFYASFEPSKISNIYHHNNCDVLSILLNGNGVYDDNVRENYADIFGTLVLLDFGLDGVPAVDNNGDGDYDDDGDIPPDQGEGNGIWDGETFENLNNNTIIIKNIYIFYYF